MKNLYKLSGIIALVVIIGFSMVACGGGTGNYSLNGTWVLENSTTTIRIDGTVGTITQLDYNALNQNALSKGHIHVGDQIFRSLTPRQYLTWTGQEGKINHNTLYPNVSFGYDFVDCTITLSEDGQMFVSVNRTSNLEPRTVWRKR
jgi:hypothetical protein